MRWAVCNLSVYRKINREYKHNLSCIVHDHRRWYRRIQSVGISQRVAKIFTRNSIIIDVYTDKYSPSALQRELYLLEMQLSPTSISTDTVRRHFTKSCIYWKSNYHRCLYRRIQSVGISQRVEFTGKATITNDYTNG
jgi:hypothetical protein